MKADEFRSMVEKKIERSRPASRKGWRSTSSPLRSAP